MSTLLQKELEKIAQKKCECVFCDVCGGTGRFEQWDITSYCDVDECPQCDGHALLEMCPRCMEMEEIYQLLDEKEGKRAV